MPLPVEITIEKLLGWVMPVVLSALVGSLITKVRAMEQRDRERDEEAERVAKAQQRGMVALLRAQLIDMHERYVESGDPCPVSVKEQATSIYQPYHELGGNGTGTRLYDEIMEAHVNQVGRHEK